MEKYWDSIRLEESVKMGLLESFALKRSCRAAGKKFKVSASTVSKAYGKFRHACAFMACAEVPDDPQGVHNPFLLDSDYLFFRFVIDRGWVYFGYRTQDISDVLGTYRKKYQPGSLYLMKPGIYRSQKEKPYGFRNSKQGLDSDLYSSGYVEIKINGNNLDKPKNQRKRTLDKVDRKNIFNIPKIKKIWLDVLNDWKKDLDFEKFKIYASEKMVRLNHTDKNEKLKTDEFMFSIERKMKETDSKDFRDIYNQFSR